MAQSLAPIAVYSSTRKQATAARSIGSPGAVGKQVQPLLGGVPRAGQELAFSQIQFQSEGRARAGAPTRRSPSGPRRQLDI